MSMKHDYIGKTDAAVLAFCQNFSTIVSENPVPFAMTVEECTEYQAMVTDYQTKLTAATEPGTRGHFTISEKDRVKKDLVALTRTYAMQINRLKNVTDTQRELLGLTIPNGPRHPVPAPETEPFIQLVSVKGRVVTIELRQEVNRRGRPAKTAGASIFTAKGETMPMTVEGWQFNRQTTKTIVEFDFGPSETADTFWISAFWYNSRGQTGPASIPVSVTLAPGGSLPSEVSETESKRKAA